MGKASRSKRGSAVENHPDKKRDLNPSKHLHSQGFLHKTGVHILLIIVLGFLAYSNTFHSPFQWDEVGQIIENPIIKDLNNFISSTKGYEYVDSNYNPRRSIGYLTFALNYHFGGLNVTGYHVVNLLIHIINSILVYFFILLTFRTPYFNGEKLKVKSEKLVVSSEKVEVRNDLPATGISSPLTTHYSLLTSDYSHLIALFSALLFVSHPVQTQAVTYVVQRFASLAAMFYLLSVVMYIKGRLATVKSEKLEVNSEKGWNSHFTFHVSRFTIVWYLLSLISAILAMKTKEIAFTLPLVIIIYEFTFFRSSLKKRLFLLLPMVLVLASILVSVIYSDKPLGEMLADVSENTKVQTHMSRWDYLMTQMRVITTYVRLIFLPVNQNFDYDYPIEHSLFTLPVFFSFLFLVTLFGTAVYLLYKTQRAKRRGQSENSEGQRAERREQSVENSSPYAPCPMPYALSALRLVAFGILWFFMTLAVESSIIPIRDVIFEHRLYLPSVGLLAAITTALFIAAQRLKMERIALYVLVLITLTFSGVTYARNTLWISKITLWEDVIKKSPHKARAHNNLGIFYCEEGHFDRGSMEFQTALEINPGYLDAHYNMGKFYFVSGRMNEALREFQTAISIKPDYAEAHNNLGTVYETLGRVDDAIREYQTSLQINPNHVPARENLERQNKMARDKSDG